MRAIANIQIFRIFVNIRSCLIAATMRTKMRGLGIISKYIISSVMGDISKINSLEITFYQTCSITVVMGVFFIESVIND